MSQEKYQPTPEEIKQAEEMMTDEQKMQSESRVEGFEFGKEHKKVEEIYVTELQIGDILESLGNNADGTPRKNPREVVDIKGDTLFYKKPGSDDRFGTRFPSPTDPLRLIRKGIGKIVIIRSREEDYSKGLIPESPVVDVDSRDSGQGGDW